MPGKPVTPMVKLTFPPKTELSRESGADLDFQDILVRWRKSLPTVSYFLGGTSIRFPDGGEIRCFQPAGGTPHAHVPEARWRISIFEYDPHARLIDKHLARDAEQKHKAP